MNQGVQQSCWRLQSQGHMLSVHTSPRLGYQVRNTVIPATKAKKTLAGLTFNGSAFPQETQPSPLRGRARPHKAMAAPNSSVGRVGLCTVPTICNAHAVCTWLSSPWLSWENRYWKRLCPQCDSHGNHPMEQPPHVEAQSPPWPHAVGAAGGCINAP